MGCSTTTFNVKSDPIQADVFFKTSKMPEKKPLGKTPLSLPMEELKKSIGPDVLSGEYFTLIVEKQDYVTEALNIPATRFGTVLTEVEVNLKKGSQVEDIKTAQEMVDRLFLAQKFALTQQYERAHIELDKVLKIYPKFSRALSMRASIYYVQKNYQESLKWYEEALKIDPQMDEAVKMSAKVRLALGVRAPATEQKP